MDLLTEAFAIPPYHWTRQHIEVLPRTYLLNHVGTLTLYDIWDRVPDQLRRDEELQSHLPCLEHYNQGPMHVDGPPPPIYRCAVCKARRTEHNHSY